MSKLRAASPPPPNRPSGASARAPVGAAESRPVNTGALRIGDLAALAGVSADTLRYYERRGLLPAAGRRASGYREYTPEAAGVVHFIKHAQALGFTLGEVDELLRLRGASGRRGAGLEVRDVAVAKLRDIHEKLRMLGALRTALADLVAECDQTCGVDAEVDPLCCPIIAALNAPGDDAPETSPAPANAARRVP